MYYKIPYSRLPLSFTAAAYQITVQFQAVRIVFLFYEKNHINMTAYPLFLYVKKEGGKILPPFLTFTYSNTNLAAP